MYPQTVHPLCHRCHFPFLRGEGHRMLTPAFFRSPVGAVHGWGSGGAGLDVLKELLVGWPAVHSPGGRPQTSLQTHNAPQRDGCQGTLIGLKTLKPAHQPKALSRIVTRHQDHRQQLPPGPGAEGPGWGSWDAGGTRTEESAHEKPENPVWGAHSRG